MNKNIWVLLTFIVLLSHSISAAVVGISPSIVRFNNMVKGGYAQTSVTASTSSEIPIRSHFTKEGEIADWITITPDTEDFVFSRTDPHTFRIIIEPPEDTQNGDYSGKITLTTDELATVERGAGSSVVTQVSLLIFVTVIGEETISCNAGAISVLDAEINNPLTVRANVENDGNVRIRPEVIIDVWDKFESEKLATYRFLGQEILPTTQQRIESEIEQDLPVGQYFAQVLIRQCEISNWKTFDILERGQIADSGEFIGIKVNEKISYVGEPTPIIPIFRNNGQRTVLAQFKGEIVKLDNDRIVKVLESDELQVEPGATQEFRLLFTPEEEGEYQVSGRVIYNNKITFQEKSKILRIAGTKRPFTLGWALLALLYIAIGLTILILIGKIRKARKK